MTIITAHRTPHTAHRTPHTAHRTLCLLIALALGNAHVFAQTTQHEDATTLDGIRVTGVRASIQKSLVDKRNALGVVDAISAEDLGKFPDLNLSESLQRISGITLDRNTEGDGRGINLRGLGPEFTRIEINGMPGLSNDISTRLDGGAVERGFNFEIFSSELFSKATVYKTGLAEVDEGGLAGTVRLETPRPLDSEGTRISASALGSYSESGGNLDPRAALLFSHNHNDTFGIAASVAWSKSRYDFSLLGGGSWRPFENANTGERASDEVRAALNPSSMRYFAVKSDTEALGSTLTLQFRPNEQMTFTVDGMYGKRKHDRDNPRGDMPIESGANIPANVRIEDGIMLGGEFTGIQQRATGEYAVLDDEYQQVTAHLTWEPDEYWTIRPFVGYARREMERDGATFSFRLAEGDTFDVGMVNYQIRGNYIDFGSTRTNFDSRPEDFLFNIFLLGTRRESDEEKQARIDFERNFADNDHVLKFGLRYNEHVKERAITSLWLVNDDDNRPTALPGLAGVHQYFDWKVKGAGPGAPSRILGVDRSRVWDVFMPGGNPIPGASLVVRTATQAQGTWMVEEKTGAAWMQADLVFGKWTVVPGVRYLRTEQISSGFDVTNPNRDSQIIAPVQFSNTWNSFLPSLNARFDLSHTIVLRGAYARTLTRPNPANLAPSETVNGTDEGGGRGTRGNPNLKPYHADNFDLGAEWYFSAEGLLAANVFYKKISDFIDTRSFVENRDYPSESGGGVIVTGPITFVEPINGVSASIKGFEISAQTRFSALPGFWGNFGGILNYSHTESSASFQDEGDVRSQGLPGLSKNSVNAVLYYDDGKLDARLAYAWRERYLATFNDEFAVPRFTDDYGQLDLSVNYHVNAHLSIQAQILNLTEEQRVDLSTSRYLPYGINQPDRRIMLGVRMTF